MEMQEKYFGENTVPENVTQYATLNTFYQSDTTRKNIKKIINHLWINLQDPHISNGSESDATVFDIPYMPYWTNDNDGVILQNICHRDRSLFKRLPDGRKEPTAQGLVYINDKLQFAQKLRGERVWDYTDQTNGFKKDTLTLRHWNIYMVSPFKKNIPESQIFNKRGNIELKKPSDYNLLIKTLTSNIWPNGNPKNQNEREIHANFLRQLYITVESQTPQLQNKEKIFYHIMKNLFPGIDKSTLQVHKKTNSFKFFIDQEVSIILSSGKTIKAKLHAAPKENNSHRKKMSSKSEYDSSASIGDTQRGELLFNRDSDLLEYAIDFLNSLEENELYFDPYKNFDTEFLNQKENERLKVYKLQLKNKKFTKNDFVKVSHLSDSFGKNTLLNSMQGEDRHGRSDMKYTDFKTIIPLQVHGSIVWFELKFMTHGDSNHSGTTRFEHYNNKKIIETFVREVPHHGISSKTLNTIIDNCIYNYPIFIQELGNDDEEKTKNIMIEDVKKGFYPVVLYNNHLKKIEKLYMNKERIDAYIKHNLFPNIKNVSTHNFDYLKSHINEKLYYIENDTEIFKKSSL